MRRRKPLRHGVLALIVTAAALTTGCHPAMTTPSPKIQPPPETLAVPLRFGNHDFSAYCYNTLSCSVVYDNYEFTRYDIDRIAPAPKSSNYREAWSASYIVMHDFQAPAEVKWTSLDGVRHEAKVDMAHIFKDHLIWHRVPKADMADFFRGPVAGSAKIILEVNGRAINVYTGMFIPTRTEQTPGNKNSNYRDDLFLVWTHTY